MPSSLVFAALVVAWLAVLVPVVARRRQAVPRPAAAHLSSRVLTRPDRPAASAAPPSEEVAMVGVTTAPHETDDDVTDEGGAAAGAERPAGGRVLDRRRGRDVPAGEDEDDDPVDLGDLGDEAGYDDDLADDEGEDDDLADDEGEDDAGYDEARDDDRHREREPFVPEYRPRTYRPGRGGFDADADAVAAGARYAFRQRVALALIAVAVLAAVAALVVTPVLWWLFAVSGVALVGYLAFLRRQTRIEEELRRRRLARLTGERRALEARRERQAEHEARMADDEWGPHPDAHDELGGHHDDLVDDGFDERFDDGSDDGSDDEDGFDDEPPRVPAPRWMAPRHTPEVPDGMELVADPDDDPAFHDLSDARVPAYRRMAAGA